MAILTDTTETYLAESFQLYRLYILFFYKQKGSFACVPSYGTRSLFGKLFYTFMILELQIHKTVEAWLFLKLM